MAAFRIMFAAVGTVVAAARICRKAAHFLQNGQAAMCCCGMLEKTGSRQQQVEEDQHSDNLVVFEREVH